MYTEMAQQDLQIYLVIQHIDLKSMKREPL
jgi:hypothetical protein